MTSGERDKPPHSLTRESADEIRNAQRSAPTQDLETPSELPEANATMRRVWNEPGGEAMSYRNAMPGAGGKADGHEDSTAAATPQTTRHLSDPTIREQEPPEADADDAATTLGQTKGREDKGSGEGHG